MKNSLQKQFIFLGLMICTIIYSFEPQLFKHRDQVIQVLTRNHIEVFSKENLYQTQLTNLSKWNDTVKGIEYYVLTHGGKKDKDLSIPLAQVLKLNNELINTIKIVYNTTFFTKGEIKGTELNRQNYVFTLENIKKQLIQVQNDLKKAFFFFKAKKNARFVLSNLALVLETTTQKAINDIPKEIALRTKK